MDLLPVAISIVSALIAAVALLMTWQYHPKPHIIVEWAGGSPRSVDGVYEFQCLFRNVGNAPASDLSLRVDLVADLHERPWLSTQHLNPGSSTEVWIPSLHVWKVKQTVGYSYEPIAKSEKPRAPIITVTWRQSPFFGWLRKKVETAPDNEIFRIFSEA